MAEKPGDVLIGIRRWCVVHGSMLDVLPTLPENSIDVCVCDPPYNLGLMGRGWDKGGIAFRPETWAEVLRVLKPGAHLIAFGGTRTWHRIAVAIEDAGFEIRDQLAWLYGQGFPKSLDLVKALDKAPDLAKRWSGWGTALKPCFEPLVLAQKPREGAWAENIERWGVGGVNADGCRIAGGQPAFEHFTTGTRGGYWGGLQGGRRIGVADKGRWPPNVLIDEAVAADLDSRFGMFGGPDSTAMHLDSGGVSRYFYCPKAPRKEREAGLEEWPVLGVEDLVDRAAGSVGARNGRAGAGRGGGRRNPHPTVKPIALMRWLVRLITPPGGVVLDPFAGSGSTGIAAALEGFRYIGVELNDTDDEPFVSIARARISYVTGQQFNPRESLRAAEPVGQPSLFDRESQ